MKSNVQIAVLTLVALVCGFWLGRASDTRVDDKLAGIETQLAQLAGAEGGQREVAAGPKKVEIDGAPWRGAEDAPVTIVEFTDYQCPFCRRVQPTIQRLIEEYPGEVRHVVKHHPLSIHPQAPTAAKAAIAAQQQGKFWEMHQRIFDNPRKLSEDDMREHARAIGLDLERFEADFQSDETEQVLAGDRLQASSLGANGTPAFFINGELLSGAQPYEVFKARVEQELSGPAA